MRSTIFVSLFAAAWAASVQPAPSAHFSKRSAYGGSAYGGSAYGGSAYGGSAYGGSAYGGSPYYDHSTLHVTPAPPIHTYHDYTPLKSPTTTGTNYFDTGYEEPFPTYGLSEAYKNTYDPFFLKHQDNSNYKYRPLSNSFWDLSSPVGGYDYSKPTGAPFFEEPVPSYFTFLIPSAITPLVKYKVGNPPDKRIVTPFSSGLFFKYPGYTGPPGITVRIPIPMARRTRIVVPQHGAVALGSGGLGYSALSGGRIALGSGSVSFANLAVARANPLPPRPPYVPSLPLRPARPQPKPQLPNSFSFPTGGFSGYTGSLRKLTAADEQSSSNSLTVFPQPNDTPNSA